MTTSRWRLRFVSTLAVGGLFALAATTAFASAPGWNRDVAGAPGTVVESGPASLSITIRTCPAGYDPSGKGAGYVRDCKEPAGDTIVQLSLEGTSGPSASTGTSGDSPQQSTVTFSNLAAGIYRIAATTPADIGEAFIGSCTSDRRSFEDYPFVPFANVVEGSATLKLVAGETLACDWYQVKADSQP